MPSYDSPSTTDPEEAWNRGREESQVRYDSAAHADFEARAVRYVLRGLGAGNAEQYLVGRARELTGDPTVSFALLHHVVTGFPVRLGVARLFYLNQPLTLEVLFRKPKRSLIYQAFQDWAEGDAADDDRHRGIIFRLPGCPGNGNRAILHTYPVPVEAEQTRVTFGVTERRAVVLYTLESLDQFLETLKRIYRPADDYA